MFDSLDYLILGPFTGTCPSSTQWIGSASNTDAVHSVEAECAGVGICSRTSGTCVCQPGFGGAACERSEVIHLTCVPDHNTGFFAVECPGKPRPCSGNGRCLAQGQAATLNGQTYSNWDATHVFGCVCDQGFEGHDCSKQ